MHSRCSLHLCVNCFFHLVGGCITGIIKPCEQIRCFCPHTFSIDFGKDMQSAPYKQQGAMDSGPKPALSSPEHAHPLMTYLGLAGKVCCESSLASSLCSAWVTSDAILNQPCQWGCIIHMQPPVTWEYVLEQQLPHGQQLLVKAWVWTNGLCFLLDYKALGPLQSSVRLWLFGLQYPQSHSSGPDLLGHVKHG